jgi:hypothetical protein
VTASDWLIQALNFRQRERIRFLYHRNLFHALKHGETTPSFKPFRENRCLFVHVPKTGGLSVTTGLFLGELAGNHQSAYLLKLLYRDEFDAMFKFAFVRNPWARVFSAYTFLRQRRVHARDAAIAKKLVLPYDNFGEFVRYGLNPRRIYHSVHLVPQFEFLCDKDKNILMDFVGRFEALDRGFSHVQKMLGLKGRQLPHRHRTIREESYRDAYDRETTAIIGALYRTDVELFGYHFDT